jgi:hypothetical protein
MTRHSSDSNIANISYVSQEFVDMLKFDLDIR